jgi:small subunit ribosomal protein S4
LARYRDSVCRLCRREGMKLFLKGDRCLKPSCAIEKRNFAPGQHGKDRKSKVVGYGLQLREKQKVKRIYGLLEGQFRNYFEKAERQKGITGENLLLLLERRLDNIVYRLGFATSRAQSRQFIGHGHVRVNNLKVNIPSYQVKSGDVVSIVEKSQKIPSITSAVEMVGSRGVPNWLELDGAKFSGKVLTLPRREDIGLPVQERLIVELYSK